MDIVSWLLILVVSILLAIPTLIYATECIAGSLPGRAAHNPIAGVRRQSVAVLVPAHDEENGLSATLASIMRQMRSGDRLLVVADNCSDDTATVARAAGAEVIERMDRVNRGKGFALDFGLAHLAHDPRDLVVFIDADCTLVDGTLDELARVAAETGRPVQSCNLMTAGGDRKRDCGIAEFAFLVKNLVRPRGLARFGLPCQLSGTGMAVPWHLIGKVQLAHAGLVEDLKLGLDLAAAGHAPVYCESAGVRSAFPETAAGLASQRRRWEHGHLAMLATSLRHLLSGKVLGNRHCLAMTLDVMVPPLALLVLLVTLASSAGLSIAMLGIGWSPLAISVGSGTMLTGATTLAWAVHGRNAVPAQVMLRIPQYVLGKARMYPLALIGRTERTWVRTDRGRSEARSRSQSAPREPAANRS